MNRPVRKCVIFALIFFAPGVVNGKDLIVSKGDSDLSTIQEAVDWASEGDVIRIKPGTYYESIIINKDDITLEAYDIHHPPVIDGSDQAFSTKAVKWTYVKDGIYKTPYKWQPDWIDGQVNDQEFTDGGGRAAMQIYENDIVLRGYRNRYNPDYLCPCAYDSNDKNYPCHDPENCPCNSLACRVYLGGPYHNISELYSENDKGRTLARIADGVPGRFFYDEDSTELYIRSAKGNQPSLNSYFIPVRFHLIEVRNSGAIIRNLVLKHSGKEAILIYNVKTKDLDKANIIIEGNYLINNHFGIHVMNTNNVIIRRNFIKEYGFWERYCYEDVKGTILSSELIHVSGYENTRNCEIYENTLYGTYGIYAGGQGMRIHDNIISHSVSVLVNASNLQDPTEIRPPDYDHDLRIYRNVLHHGDSSAVAVSFNELGNVWFYRNVIYNTRFMNKDGGTADEEVLGKKYFYHNTMVMADVVTQHPYVLPPMRNSIYRNNIIESTDYYWLWHGKKVSNGWSFFPFKNGPDADYNLYWHIVPTNDPIKMTYCEKENCQIVYVAVELEGGTIDDCPEQFEQGYEHDGKIYCFRRYKMDEFEEMSADTGLEMHGLQADPLFVNAAVEANLVNDLAIDEFSAEDYRRIIQEGYDDPFEASFDMQYLYFTLQSQSPAIDRGKILPEEWPDIYDDLALPDMGAVESSRLLEYSGALSDGAGTTRRGGCSLVR